MLMIIPTVYKLGKYDLALCLIHVVCVQELAQSISYNGVEHSSSSNTPRMFELSILGPPHSAPGVR